MVQLIAATPILCFSPDRFTNGFFLNNRDNNIAFKPMSQVVEEKPHKKALDIENEIQFVNRTGYVDRYPKPVSLRHPVDLILEIKSIV